LNASLNSKRAFLSKEEYDKRHNEDSKKFYQNHKDKIQIYRAQFYQEHADEINANRAVKFGCGCGSICRIGNKARHELTKKHQTYLASLIK
jgi:2-polyprenyl-3-methyl-5-hydroxy-6-metoxy-1,4-benzoquinol methylase